MNEPEARFYLKPLTSPKSQIWYSRQCLGKNKIGSLMKSMAAKSQLEGRKVNHSVRKTFGTALLNGGRPLTEVADLGGWKSVESVKSYVTPSLKEQEKASDTISTILIPSPSCSTINDKPIDSVPETLVQKTDNSVAQTTSDTHAIVPTSSNEVIASSSNYYLYYRVFSMS